MEYNKKLLKYSPFGMKVPATFTTSGNERKFPRKKKKI
jgi:hypothetical protein